MRSKRILVWVLCLLFGLMVACRSSLIPVGLRQPTTSPAGDASQEPPAFQPEATWTVMAPPTQPPLAPKPTWTDTVPDPVESQNVGTADCEGVSFKFSLELADAVDCAVIPAVPDEGADWGGSPRIIQVSLKGYSLANTFHQPAISIYPVAEYQAVSGPAASVIQELGWLLDNRPADPGLSMPFIPIWNAAQVFHARLAYLDFQKGSGIRFLTMYGQAAFPVNNQAMFYTYQALTGDGQYYISVILPIGHPTLSPDGADIPGGDYDAFSTNFADYLEEVTDSLNKQSDSSFIPQLKLLDGLVQSIRVDR